MNKMDPSIKSLTITGSAAEDANKSRRPLSRKKRPSKIEEEDFLEQAKEYSQTKTSPVILKPVTVAPIITIPSVQAPSQAQVIPQKPQYIPQPLEKKEEPQYDGAAKVILKPARNPRVKLQPKNSQVQPVSSQVNTRKARRIRLSVSSLSHRFTRAKKVKDDMEKNSINTIREYLIQKGVIQEKSKAPERMLRSMYKDFMLLKDTAL